MGMFGECLTVSMPPELLKHDMMEVRVIVCLIPLPPLRSNAAERPWATRGAEGWSCPHFTRWQRNLKPKTQSVDLKLRLISG